MEALSVRVRSELGLAPRPPAVGTMPALVPAATGLESQLDALAPDDVARRLQRLGSSWRPATSALADVVTGRSTIVPPHQLELLRPFSHHADALAGGLLVEGAGAGARHVPRAPRTVGNSAELLVRNEQYLPRLYADLADARSSITISQFNWEADGSGRRVLDLLKQKAAEGRDVRVMVDAYGFRERGLRPARTLQREMEAAGIQVKSSWPFLPRQGWEHRKLITIDDRVSYAGGLGFGAKYDSWTDLMVRLEGPSGAVAGAHGLTTWRDLAGPHDARAADRLRQIGTVLERQVAAKAAGLEAGAAVTLLENRPGIDLAATEAFLRDARAATTRLWATSTYVTTPVAVRELAEAARRGVDVKLVVTGLEAGNDVKTIRLGRSHYRELLDAGAEVFERTDGVMHAKSWIADDVATVGSMNLSHNSMKRAREVMVRVEDEAFSRAYEAFHTALRGQTRKVLHEHLDSVGMKALTLARRLLDLKT